MKTSVRSQQNIVIFLTYNFFVQTLLLPREQ